MNKTQAGRLLTLAHFLRTRVPPEEFDMRCFAGSRLGPTVGSCGVSACALGWATVIWPSVFRLEWSGACLLASLRHVPTAAYTPYTGLPVCRFFGIEKDEAAELFGTKPATPEQKAEQIEELVDSYGYTYADGEAPHE